MNGETSPSAAAERRWRPLTPVQRRVVGVLVEKAKTTPDAYPMTLNALVAGCNQKSNRNPQMSLAADDVQQALDELREMGAVAEVRGGGRVPKYRHYLYEWLGVEKSEMAVMADLLLRGEQTLGELRGHAARMASIPDIGALRPILQSLMEKELVTPLTPEGRGQIVAHTLYPPDEMEALRQQYAGAARPAAARAPRAAPAPDQLNQLEQAVDELRRTVDELSQRVAALESRR